MKPDNSIIIVEKDNGPFENAKSALSKLDLNFIKGKSVLIKPNVGRSAKKTKGVNTHPEAVAGVIEALKEFNPSKISIGESPLVGINTLEAFEKGGFTDVAKKYGCELIDFNAYKPLRKNIPNARVVESTLICAPIFEYDILLSLPVAKTHMHTGVTLGIKNLKGCLYKHEKVRYHQLEYIDGKTFPEKTLDTAISDLATILFPDITVIDGFMGMQGLGPSGGESIQSNFAVASLNPFGADIVGCTMMGINPSDIPHLKLISERRNFSINVSDYNIIPQNYNNKNIAYKKPPKEISIKYPDVVLQDKGSCSACQSTLMLFLKRFKDDLLEYALEDGKIHLAIGKGIDLEATKNGTLLIGNCTHKAKHKGHFVPGCPPVPTKIFEELTGRQPDENEPEIE